MSTGFLSSPALRLLMVISPHCSLLLVLSLHFPGHPPVLPVIFLLFCHLLVYLSQSFSVISCLSFSPCVQSISAGSFTLFANHSSLSSNFFYQVFHFPSLFTSIDYSSKSSCFHMPVVCVDAVRTDRP